jgi:hypothetical protein
MKHAIPEATLALQIMQHFPHMTLTQALSWCYRPLAETLAVTAARLANGEILIGTWNGLQWIPGKHLDGYFAPGHVSLIPEQPGWPARHAWIVAHGVQ